MYIFTLDKMHSFVILFSGLEATTLEWLLKKKNITNPLMIQVNFTDFILLCMFEQVLINFHTFLHYLCLGVVYLQAITS